MYGYIYLTTNLINNKKYIGQHCADAFDTSYYGSGKHLKAAIAKYGIENFKCELIKECFSQEELDTSERYYIELNNAVLSEEYYNIALGGKMCQLAYQTEETKEKISIANKGKKRTEEANLKNSEYRKNSKWMHKNDKQQLVPPKDVNIFLDNGWIFGMLPNRKSYISSEDKKQKISNALKNKKKKESSVKTQKESFAKQKYHWYTNGVNDILVSEFDAIPEGYTKGRHCSEESKLKNSLAHKNKIPWNKNKKLK